jgi:hypothetical protein
VHHSGEIRNPHQRMTYQALLTEFHSHFDQLYSVWKSSAEQTGSDGVLALLPGGYATADHLAKVEIAFWSREMLNDYLTAHQQPTAEPFELLDDMDREREFPAFIVEADDQGKAKGFHLHRIIRVETN